ncbi:MAG: DUF308 domain-containing protein [Desulfuromonadales bacterium]|nr:DUF308 domain-containing protein [Desulfuromonadales bacterium]
MDYDKKKKPGVWLLIVGILMCVAGIYMWVEPLAVIVALALYLGIIFIVSGIGYIATFFAGWSSGWLLANGLIDLILGIVLITHLRLTIVTLPIILALWIIFVGVLRVAAAFKLKAVGFPKWGWSFVFGFLSILFGMFIIANPLVGVLSITVVLGTFMLIYGVFVIMEYFAGFTE